MDPLAGVPSGWEIRTVESLGQVKGGKRLPAGHVLTDLPNEHPYIRVTDMRPGGVDIAGLRYVPPTAAEQIRNYRIFRDDLFISVAGTLGIVGRVPPQVDGANLTENADRITAIQCDPGYLMHFLMSERIQAEVESIRTVGAQPKLALGRIKTFEIAIPRNRSEQKRIAEALTDADELIVGLERLITKKQAIKQGMMQQLLTGQTRLPGFTREWLPLEIASQSELRARIGWQGLTASEYRNVGEYRLVGGTEFRDGRVDWKSTPYVDAWRFEQDRGIQLRPGDVLITKDGTIGKVAYIQELPGPATLNSGVFVVRPLREAYDSHFFYFLLRSRVFEDFLLKLKAGSTISHLYQRDLVGLVLDMPPSLREQRAIASALADTDAEIDVLRSRLGKARAIKVGMMQELLTGRTRLPVTEGVA